MLKTRFYMKRTLGLLTLSFLIATSWGNIFTTLTYAAPHKEQNTWNIVSNGPLAAETTSLTAEEQLALDLLNADRTTNGLAPLKLNLAVTAVAQRHAQDEINRDFFAHNNPDGLSPFDRMHAAGISFRYGGENLAINQDVTAAQQALMNSPGHRANILSPDYTEVGIGIRYNSQGTLYVVQCFIGR
ncbi:MAG: SCP-like extracellular [Firmicutes bacterium]|nr:SCP-like extracellular [Bacillota bacterium]